MTDGPYRDGKVHVLAAKCKTCIFRPGNLMHLKSGRVKDMVDQCIENQSAIPCHATIYRDDVQPAVCRGFYDAHRTQPLQVAERMGLIVEDGDPNEH